MLTQNQTIAILQSLGHEPRKSYGQNFLVDKNIVEISIKLAKLKPDDNVVEVGPGLGTLSSAILATGASLTSIEKDDHFIEYLSETFPSLNLIHEDATKVDYAQFNQIKKPGHGAAGPNYKIVANLPYAVATPLLEKFLLGLPQSMTLMIQRELAERWAATAGKKFSAISIFLQSAYALGQNGGIAHSVGRKCFFPPPKVDSVLAHYTLREKPIIFSPERQKLIRSLFLHRRKQLHKAAEESPVTAAWFNKLIEEKKIKPTARAEEIPLELWQILSRD